MTTVTFSVGEGYGRGVCSVVFEGWPFEAASYCVCWVYDRLVLLPHEGRLVVDSRGGAVELSVKVGLS